MLNRKGLNRVTCSICPKVVMWLNVVEIIDPGVFADFLCSECVENCPDVEVILEEPNESMDASEETNNVFSHLLRSAGIHTDRL